MSQFKDSVRGGHHQKMLQLTLHPLATHARHAQPTPLPGETQECDRPLRAKTRFDFGGFIHRLNSETRLRLTLGSRVSDGLLLG